MSARRFRCGGCGFEMDDDSAGCERCGSWDVTERTSSRPPAARPDLISAVAASTQRDEPTVRLVFALEQLCRAHPRAHLEQALAAALWRAMNQRPELRSTSELFLTALHLREGGWRVTFEADLVPPLAGERI
jgi:hypothetical protein